MCSGCQDMRQVAEPTLQAHVPQECSASSAVCLRRHAACVTPCAWTVVQHAMRPHASCGAAADGVRAPAQGWPQTRMPAAGLPLHPRHGAQPAPVAAPAVWVPMATEEPVMMLKVEAAQHARGAPPHDGGHAAMREERTAAAAEVAEHRRRAVSAVRAARRRQLLHPQRQELADMPCRPAAAKPQMQRPSAGTDGAPPRGQATLPRCLISDAA